MCIFKSRSLKNPKNSLDERGEAFELGEAFEDHKNAIAGHLQRTIFKIQYQIFAKPATNAR